MNTIRFLKDWTLPVAMATGTLVYLLFAYTPALDGVAEFFGPRAGIVLPVFMFVILFVTFCKVDFHKMRPVGWHLWVGVFQVLFVFAAVGVVLGFDLQGRSLVLMEALLTCIIGPSAAAAAVVTSKLGGSLEETTTYTFLSNIITAVLIPVCFPIIDKAADISFMEAFTKILREVCLVLLVPMAAAYVVKHFMKGLHRRIVSVKDLSYYLWAVALALVTGVTVRSICHAQTSAWFLLSIALLGMMLCIIQFAVGRFIGHYFNRTVEAGQALGQKNTTFAIWVAYTYLNPLSSVGPGCYILWQNIINSIEIWMERKKGEKGKKV